MLRMLEVLDDLFLKGCLSDLSSASKNDGWSKTTLELSENYIERPTPIRRKRSTRFTFPPRVDLSQIGVELWGNSDFVEKVWWARHDLFDYLPRYGVLLHISSWMRRSPVPSSTGRAALRISPRPRRPHAASPCDPACRSRNGEGGIRRLRSPPARSGRPPASPSGGRRSYSSRLLLSLKARLPSNPTHPC
jgi:hypothetical protein